MKKLFLLSSLFWSGVSFCQNPQTIKLQDLQTLMSARKDQIQIINFWATWCAPCVRELPLFEKLTSEGRKDVKITLVSMDLDLDPNPEKVYRFVSRKNVQSEVLLLDEQDPNSWINKIDRQWSGALPATIIINQKTGARKFIGKQLHEGDLEKYLKELE